MVLQTPHLFSGTIRENIRYGRLEASDQEVEDAAQLAGAHAFIEKLEKGYESRWVRAACCSRPGRSSC
jgi:ATP-binding cassette subfamily B protein